MRWTPERPEWPPRPENVLRSWPIRRVGCRNDSGDAKPPRLQWRPPQFNQKECCYANSDRSPARPGLLCRACAVWRADGMGGSSPCAGPARRHWLEVAWRGCVCRLFLRFVVPAFAVDRAPRALSAARLDPARDARRRDGRAARVRSRPLLVAPHHARDDVAVEKLSSAP